MVSVDEAHIYRGIFGANVHHLFWRLKRLVPSNLCWIGTSATIGEGKRFFEKLIGEEVVSIQKSGAPRPKRNLCVLQPKGSPYTLACFLMEKLLEKEKRTVTFTKARRITELVYNWLINRNPKYRKLVSSYRAGFLPSERRKIEQNFFDGTLLGVVSTSAMEAGIDIGNLDACILIGFPGSLVSLYQRMGRVGRGQTPADIFLITMPDALDQYYLSHPQELLTRDVEEPILDPYNDYITEGHILCAAKEMPLNDCDYPPSHPLRKTIDLLDEKGRLILDESGTRWHTLSRNPHREINFRSIGESFEIVDENEKTIGTIDGVRVYRECHEGAVYLHQGQSYEVEKISEK
ncbi:MAG: DEAD/DEAH box helicase, partial [Thermoanaerobaculaceae bacterium]|nr:DEAD/DEAH box helicase [Thermoanaerobaculaceae bacterium]